MISKNQFHILIVEDNQSMREGLLTSLQKEGYTVQAAIDGQEAWELFNHAEYHLVITDLRMPRLDGLELFRRINRSSYKTDVILITAYATVEVAVAAMKEGAEDFITKPFALAELRLKVSQAFEKWRTRSVIAETQADPGLLIGNSAAIQQIRELIARTARSDSPVLITGESGTGKEVVARLIHAGSSRNAGPFIAVNCGALSESLLESELFGHEKGAFTGAIKTHVGKFEQSHLGTLFLDEIGDMSPNLQVKLLRVLQTHQFPRVGGEKQITSDFRLICATNKDLTIAIKDGQFRSELYYRINVIPIHLPPLRERATDIPLLVNSILAHKAAHLKRPAPQIEKNVLRKLMAYSWPGNIRELENFLERSLIFIEGDTISDEIFGLTNIIATNASSTLTTDDLTAQLYKIERELIVNALRDCHGIKQHAADLLKIKASTLYYKMDKYKITKDEYA